MHFPKLPDWLIYGAVVSALLVVAIGRQERSGRAAAAAAGARRRRPAPGPRLAVRSLHRRPGAREGQPGSGTAFSVDDGGSWLTARHVVDGCREAAIVVADGRGVAARVTLDPTGDAAILTTEGGAPAVPLRAPRPNRPAGASGPIIRASRKAIRARSPSRLLGRENLVIRGAARRVEPVLVWAEVGRTDNLKGTLSGLSGAPALDSAGRVIGVTVAESPRRGRIYTTARRRSRTCSSTAAAVRPASPWARRSPPRTTAASPTACAATCAWPRWCA